MASGPYQEKSIGAAKVLVDKLAPQDKMAIVTGLKVWMNFTNDKIVLKKTLDSLAVEWELIRRLGGSTGRKETWRGCSNDFCSLLAVLNEMFDGSERQPIIIFQSDGVQVIYLKPDKDTPYRVSYTTLDRSGLKYITRIICQSSASARLKKPSRDRESRFIQSFLALDFSDSQRKSSWSKPS